MIDISLQLLLGLMCIAMVAGFIDSIAGGGGLITIPALMWAGFPPTVALGTNKLQACGGSFFASLYFVRQRIIDFKSMRMPFFAAFIGATVGATIVQFVDPNHLKKILPFLILAVGCYFLFSKKVTDIATDQKVSYNIYALTAGFGIGVYDGFIGPSTGSFFALSCIALLGFGLTKATAHAKVLNFITNFSSLLVFIAGGKVIWSVGLTMLVGQAIGASIGARLVVTKGAKIVKPLVVLMSFVISADLISKAWF